MVTIRVPGILSIGQAADCTYTDVQAAQVALPALCIRVRHSSDTMEIVHRPYAKAHSHILQVPMPSGRKEIFTGSLGWRHT
eukprot:5881331-Amphidinium_carterae.1